MLMSVFVEVRAIGGGEVVIMLMSSVTMLMTGGMRPMYMLRIHDCGYEETRWFEMSDEKLNTTWPSQFDGLLYPLSGGGMTGILDLNLAPL